MRYWHCSSDCPEVQLLLLWLEKKFNGVRIRADSLFSCFSCPNVLAILKYHIAVFVDGEFWHGKDWETRKKRLKRNREYWIEKIEENMARDLRDDQLLMQAGWTPIHFWEKEVIKDLSMCVATIEEIILYHHSQCHHELPRAVIVIKTLSMDANRSKNCLGV